MMKICKVHNIEKVPYGKKNIKYVCRLCNKEQQAKWWKENKKAQQEKVKKNRNKLSEFVLSLKKDKECLVCGETNPLALEFDHKFSKKDSISEMCRKGNSKKLIKEEIKKCRVLCSSCHQIKTMCEQNAYTFQKVKKEKKYETLLTKIENLVKEDKEYAPKSDW